MTQRKPPKFWETWKGRVIRAIVEDGEQTFPELQKKTGLAPSSLNRVLSELYGVHCIENRGGRYRVTRELYDQYRNYLGSGTPLEIVQRVEQTLDKNVSPENANLINQIETWRKLKKLDFSLETKHFFLGGMDLDDLSKLLICQSTHEVLVVNPYIEQCDLSNTLRDHLNRSVRVLVVTRPPKHDDNQSLARKKKYHEILRKEGVNLVYNESVHAKLIVVDQTVAIVSSMNFYSGSSAGASWEAGLVSIDKNVVDAVAHYILGLKEKPESQELDSSDVR